MKRTQKAIKLSLFGLAAFLAVFTTPIISAKTNTPKYAEILTPEQSVEKALTIIKPFFADPNHKVTRSFSSICLEVADLLDNSHDSLLQELAKALREACKKSNAMMVGIALKKYEGVIKQFIGEMLPGTVLLARLNTALKIK